MIELQFYLKRNQALVPFQHFRTLYQLPGAGREVYRGIARTRFCELPTPGLWELHWDHGVLPVEVLLCRRLGAIYQVDLMAAEPGNRLAERKRMAQLVT